MQRHRNQRVGLGQQFGAGPRHQPAERGGELDAVGIFQRVHEITGDLAEHHGGAGAADRPAAAASAAGEMRLPES